MVGGFGQFRVARRFGVRYRRPDGGLGGLGPAEAAPPQLSVPTDEQLQSTGPGVDTGPFGFMNNLARSNFMLGNMWGLRPFLSRYGISIGLQETSEVLGNLRAGVRKASNMTG